MAALVGTPPMNVLSGTLERHQDQLALRLGSGDTVPLRCRIEAVEPMGREALVTGARTGSPQLRAQPRDSLRLPGTSSARSATARRCPGFTPITE